MEPNKRCDYCGEGVYHLTTSPVVGEKICDKCGEENGLD